MTHEPHPPHPPEGEQQSKRQVSYNQDAVLCKICKKRIRLNNNGRVRIHVFGKSGSDKCSGSNAEVITDAEVQALADEAEAGYDLSRLSPRNPSKLFSDPA